MRPRGDHTGTHGAELGHEDEDTVVRAWGGTAQPCPSLPAPIPHSFGAPEPCVTQAQLLQELSLLPTPPRVDAPMPQVPSQLCTLLMPIFFEFLDLCPFG